jgi:hypothetical protein
MQGVMFDVNEYTEERLNELDLDFTVMQVDREESLRDYKNKSEKTRKYGKQLAKSGLEWNTITPGSWNTLGNDDTDTKQIAEDIQWFLSSTLNAYCTGYYVDIQYVRHDRESGQGLIDGIASHLSQSRATIFIPFSIDTPNYARQIVKRHNNIEFYTKTEWMVEPKFYEQECDFEAVKSLVIGDEVKEYYLDKDERETYNSSVKKYFSEYFDSLYGRGQLRSGDTYNLFESTSVNQYESIKDVIELKR